jgi:hypothetical protein
VTVFRRLREWIARERQWHRDHRAGWGANTPVTSEGLTSFQVSIEGAALQELSRLGKATVDRRIVRDRDGSPTVSARLEGTDITIWISVDEAQVGGPGIDVRLERWDARTPAELQAEFVKALSRAAQGNPGVVA